LDTSYVHFCGWQTHIYDNIGGFILEAKANWGHTCIAGGFIILDTNSSRLIVFLLSAGILSYIQAIGV